MVDKYNWEPPVILPDGHRLFPVKGTPFKHVAIADNSGREPQNTEDGVLWIDRKYPLMITYNEGREVFSIPLTSDTIGDHRRTLSDAATLLYLSATFNWPIVDQTDGNNVYKVESQ
jgi:hypothetical protein